MILPLIIDVFISLSLLSEIKFFFFKKRQHEEGKES